MTSTKTSTLIALLSGAVLGAGFSIPLHAATINIDIDETTVSGLSSGGYMATQFQLAHADIVKGAGIVAAGPYYCAQNAITTALAECVTKTSDDFSIEPLNAFIKQQQLANKLADENAISNQNVLVIRGTNDETVNQKTSNLLVKQYQSLGVENIKYVDEKPFSHVFPTLEEGGECTVSQAPFIGACDYDAAGEILKHLYGELSPPSDAVKEHLIAYSTHDTASPAKAGMSDETFAYIPSSCQQGEKCVVHISFHGCNQSGEDVGDAYASLTGFNRWAESNNMIVLYPQAKKSKLFPMNPQGCWDWWGYTDENYATKDGQQVKAVRAMLDDISNVMARKD